ncbi:MAG: lactate utilization protein LutB domain-containing protein, partial [Acidobacteriota bacterium]
SSLCGACYEVCPVKINIPEILIHLRSKIVQNGDAPMAEAFGMKMAAFTLFDSGRLASAQKLVQLGHKPLEAIGLPGWSATRDLPSIPKQSFREWWAKRSGDAR